MDRPKQAARSLARMTCDDDHEDLRQRLVVRRGPPFRDLAKHSGDLLALARRAGAGLVVVDSIKDAAVGLSDDEVGAGWNRAVQTCLASGVDVLALHHNRKAAQGAAKPRSIDDVYGSTWITAGARSVVLLWGQPGDLVVELVHLKQPMASVGPFKVEQNPATGEMTVMEGFDLLSVLRNSPQGLTAKEGAQRQFGVDRPSATQQRQVKRSLDRLLQTEAAHRQLGKAGGSGGSRADRYYATTQREEP